MKKIFKILLYFSIFFLILITFSGCNSQKNNQTNNQNKVDISRTSTVKDTFENNDNYNNRIQKSEKETELANFSTPLTSGVANRIINIKLTCGKTNEKVFQNGESFSFNQIVGPCTAEEGYKEAEIYVNKKIKYALGGGNCQVSTTLYNALVAVPGIQITERHEHGMPVDYIEDGKDATVSYNTLDLKFTNNTGNAIKLYTWCDDVNVYAKVTQITYE